MRSLTRGFAAFKHPNYRLFWIGQTISLVGTWMQTVAQSWLVLQLSGSAVDLGIVNALQMFPMLFIGPFGGVVADRFPKRRLLVITQTSQLLLALVLGILASAHVVQLWHVYALATLLGISNAFDMPIRQAFVIEMVGRDDLMNAVALGSMQFNAARIIGPALAGLSIELIGVTGSFYANAISFVFVIGGLLMMRSSEFFAVPPPERAPVLTSLRQGAAYVWRAPAVLTITAMVGVLGLFAFNSNVLVPLFATDVLHSGAQGYGLLMAAMGAGSLVAALVAAYARRARWEVLVLGAAGFCGFEVLFAFSQQFWLSFALLGFAGFALILFFTVANTAIQQQVPDQLRGRVMGVYMTVNMGITPFGNLASGAIAGAFGAPASMIVGAGAGLVFALGTGAWLAGRRTQPGFALDVPYDGLEVQYERPARRAEPAIESYQPAERTFAVAERRP